MKVIVLRGGSGSGKSTWIKRHYPDAFVFSADKYFETETGEYVFIAAEIGLAHAHCLRSFVNMITSVQGHDTENDVVIVDNTNTSVAEFAPYVAVAQAHGAEVQILTFVYDPVAAYKRNTHGTPLKSCIDQHRRLQEESGRIPPWWKHDYVLWDETWPYANTGQSNILGDK